MTSLRCSTWSQRAEVILPWPTRYPESQMETRPMSPNSSMATPPSASARFAAVAVFATLMGVAALASAQADACPPEHRKVDKRIHDSMHRQRSDRERSERQNAEGVQSQGDRAEQPVRQRVIVRAKAGMRGVLEL